MDKQLVDLATNTIPSDDDLDFEISDSDNMITNVNVQRSQSVDVEYPYIVTDFL